MIDCMLDYLGAHAPALYTYDNRPLIAVSAIPSNKSCTLSFHFAVTRVQPIATGGGFVATSVKLRSSS